LPLITLDDTHTYKHTFVRTLSTSNRPLAETSTQQHTTHKRETSIPPAGFEPAVPDSGRPHIHALVAPPPGIRLLWPHDVLIIGSVSHVQRRYRNVSSLHLEVKSLRLPFKWSTASRVMRSASIQEFNLNLSLSLTILSGSTVREFHFM